MVYLVEYSRDSAKFIKKARRNKKLSDYLNQVNKRLADNYLGLSAEPLNGSLRFLTSHHFKIGGVDYRLVFSVNQVRQSIYVWLIGPRENFYRQLVKKFG